MAFKGLFIGVDRYLSPSINWLTCARRDAVALHALFLDNLGGTADLLADQDATKQAIAERFAGLAHCDNDDTVVIAFSGHGSSTHELVAHDTDPRDVAGTAIPLTTLTDWIKAIPARRLIVILDCCFSGGAGAKVLQAEIQSRDMASESELLAQMSGEGRLILTASTAQQPAWEAARHGHGLLTYYFLQALRGADDVRESGRVSIYQLLEYVTKRVSDSVSQFGKLQHPTLRGTIDAALSWPAFVPGERYRTAFPARTTALASADVLSLASFGFPQQLLQCWAGSIPSLNALQLAAVNDFRLFDGEHLLISAPTSSGKTMIGELAALHGAMDRRRAVFLLPLKALVNDKYRHFTSTYSGFGLRIIRATGDIADDVPALLRGQYDIALLTYEKFAAIILGASHVLEQIGTVVIDEVQMIADRSRGVALEFLITLLRMRRNAGIEPQLIALSAVIGDTNGFERWLNARLLRRNERPVPLSEGLLCADGSFRHIDANGAEKVSERLVVPEYRKGSSQDWLIPLVRRLVAEQKQVIVFRETKAIARSCASYLAESLALPPAAEALDAMTSADPSLATEQLRACLHHGVAFHVADLDADERRIVEETFRQPNSSLRVIVATTTLAMGINTPAEAVVIAGLKHPGDQPYSVAEYKNMVGRAGRLGFATEGTSYTIALSSHEEHHLWTNYVTATPEGIDSRFVSDGDPRSLILRVLASAQRSVHDGIALADVIDFLEGSFGAYRHQQRSGTPPWSRQQLTAAIEELRQHRLIEDGADERYHLTSLGRFAGESGVEVESMIRLVDTLHSVSSHEINDQTLIAATQLTVELDRVLFPINRKSTQKEPHVWPRELHRQAVAPAVVHTLGKWVTDRFGPTLRAKKAVACLLWVSDQPIAQTERIMTQFGGAFGGAAGPIRAVATRTRDLLPIVMEVACTLHPQLDFADSSARLLVRLELGIPGPAADLGRFAGTQIARAEYLQLLASGLCNLDRLEAATDEELLRCISNNQDKLAILRAAAKELRQCAAAGELPPLPIYSP